MEVVNQHAPLKEKRVKCPKQPDWFNEDIQQASYLRDKYSATNDHNYMKTGETKPPNKLLKPNQLIYTTERNFGISFVSLPQKVAHQHQSH